MRCDDTNDRNNDRPGGCPGGCRGISRRELLAAGCRRALVLLPVLATAAPRSAEAGQSAAPTGWLAAGKVNRFPPGTPVPVTLPDKRQIFIARTKAGGVRALSARCTHAGCAVQWRAPARQFVCPCHGATFREDGSHPTGPARTPLPAVTVRVQDGVVWVAPGGGPPPNGRSRKGRRDAEEEHGEREGRGGRPDRDDDD